MSFATKNLNTQKACAACIHWQGDAIEKEYFQGNNKRIWITSGIKAECRKRPGSLKEGIYYCNYYEPRYEYR